MVLVVSIVAMVTILVTIILTVSLMNIQMKAVNKNSIDNFYDAEAAMDEIRVGLQQEVSLAASTAYVKVMESYSITNYQDEQRRSIFRTAYRNELKNRLKDADDNNLYDLTKLEKYIGSSHRYDTATDTGAKLQVIDGKTLSMILTEKGLVLENLEVYYRNADSYVSVVDTDIVLGYPEMNFTQSASVPDLLQYCIVADEGVDVDGGNRSLYIDGNIYAGAKEGDDTQGFTVKNTSNVVIKNRKTVITEGDINLQENAIFTTEAKVTLWADNLNLKNRSVLDISGTAYIADDLNIEGSGSATLRGEYYGYGNPKTARLADSITDAQVEANESAYSSAMIINGIADSGKASISMTALTKLMLAGNAYIGSGKAMMGESLAVKSNQIAYLAPADCFKVDTANPTVRTDLQDYIEPTALAKYSANGIIMQTNSDGLSYYFLKFANAKMANQFYEQYYSADSEMGAQHTEKRNKYLNLYVDEKALTIKESSKVEKMLNGSILIWDKAGIRTIAPEFTDENTDIADDSYYAKLQSGWQDMYASYTCNLTADYVRLSAVQKSSSVFENLVDVDALKAIVSADSKRVFTYTDSKGEHQAHLVRKDDLLVDKDYLTNAGGIVDMIVATGNVTVTTDFTGIILAGGKITFKDFPVEAASLTISAAAETVAGILHEGTCDIAGTKHVLSEFLKDSDYYIGTISLEEQSEDRRLDIAQLVTYQNWSKE